MKSWRDLTEDELDLARDVIEAAAQFYRDTEPHAVVTIGELERGARALPDWDEVEGAK